METLKFFERSFTRVEFSNDCKIEHNGVCYKAELINISVGGFFLKSECGIGVGDKVLVHLTSHDYGIDSLLAFNCSTMRISEEGVGVEIVESDALSFLSLLDIICNSGGDCRSIKKEISNATSFAKLWKGGQINSPDRL
jgi:hypothetical protein